MLHRIVKLTVMDVRFPTSLEQHGSDAMVRKLQQPNTQRHVIQVNLGPQFTLNVAAAH